MSIIVGFVPTPAGEAALTAGIAEAKLRVTGSSMPALTSYCRSTLWFA